jgi:hypothetical protein
MARSAGMDVVNIQVEIPPARLAEVRAMLARVDPKLKTALAKDLRTGLSPIASRIVADFPKVAPLSGMGPRWGQVSAKVVTNSMAKPGRALALINVRGETAFARLLSITERAGSRSNGFSGRGRAMISNPRGGLQERFPLDGKGGRFVFRSFRSHLPEAIAVAMKSIDRFIDNFNRSG